MILPPVRRRGLSTPAWTRRGDVIGVMIDGARLLTPGVLHFALAGAALAPRAVVTTLSWVLGWDSIHTRAQRDGFDRAREDAALESIGWPSDGYRMFELGAPTWTSSDGWFQPLMESNALFMSADLWKEIGGADERFDEPGGGFLNLDMLRNALEAPETTQVLLPVRRRSIRFTATPRNAPTRRTRSNAVRAGAPGTNRFTAAPGVSDAARADVRREASGGAAAAHDPAGIEVQPGRSRTFGVEFDQDYGRSRRSSDGQPCRGHCHRDGAVGVPRASLRGRGCCVPRCPGRAGRSTGTDAPAEPLLCLDAPADPRPTKVAEVRPRLAPITT